MLTTPIAIATHDPKSQRATIRIAPADLLRSVYVTGKTGTGKSVFLERLFLGAVQSGFGACLIDPHGDLAQTVLELLPKSLTNSVIVFAPKDTASPVGLNLLAPTPGASRSLVASMIVEVFRKLWGQTLFGPRSEHLLRNGVLMLLENPGTTLPSLLRLLVDEPYRMKLLARVTDPVVRLYWTKEFPGLSKTFVAEVTSPIQNKLGALTAPVVRRVLGQAAPRLSLPEVMANSRILIADLSGIGRDAAELIGAILVAGIALAARLRDGTPESERPPFLLVADEFQSYMTESFAELLAEGRKFGLAAALAHQHAAQLPDSVRSAILGNVGTVVAFRVSAEDALALEPEFAPEVVASELIRLRRYRVALKLVRSGMPQRAMLCRTLAPLPRTAETADSAATTTRVSSERYGRAASAVDRDLETALGPSSIRPPS